MHKNSVPHLPRLVGYTWVFPDKVVKGREVNARVKNLWLIGTTDFSVFQISVKPFYVTLLNTLSIQLNCMQCKCTSGFMGVGIFRAETPYRIFFFFIGLLFYLNKRHEPSNPIYIYIYPTYKPTTPVTPYIRHGGVRKKIYNTEYTCTTTKFKKKYNFITKTIIVTIITEIKKKSWIQL